MGIGIGSLPLAGPVSLVEYSTVRRVHQMESKKRKKTKKSRATASDGGMVIVQGTRKKNLKIEHEVKMLNDPNPTSPDGRVKFDPPTFRR